MSYQIKEVSELLGISIYTLRYYERIGLLNNVKRGQYGRREFSEDDILTLNTVECLKQTGMSLQNIKRYVQLVGEGIDTAPERLQLFERQQAKVEAQMQDLQEKLDLINGKVKYYQTAVEEGRLDVCHDEKSALVQKLLQKEPLP